MMKLNALLFSLALLAVARAAFAGPEGPIVESSSFLAHLPTIYSGADDAFIEKIALTGIVHYQTAVVRANTDSIEEAEFRRFRFGSKMAFGDHFVVSGSANFHADGTDPFYRNLSKVYLAWSPYGNDKKSMQRFQIIAGKLRPKFTREFSTSAKKIRTFERSQLSNQVTPSKATGIWLEGKKNRWGYVISGFSGDKADEFSQFKNGFIGLAKLEYKAAEEFMVGLDFMSGTAGQDLTESIDYAASLSSEWNTSYKLGQLSLVTDLIYFKGDEADDGDKWGLVFMPAWQLTDKLEVVARYQLSSSSSDTGLRLQKRYERSAVPKSGERGDLYQAGWLGLNYYLNDHKLKLMTGVEYSYLDGAEDFSSWSWFSGVRLYF